MDEEWGRKSVEDLREHKKLFWKEVNKVRKGKGYQGCSWGSVEERSRGDDQRMKGIL